MDGRAGARRTIAYICPKSNHPHGYFTGHSECISVGRSSPATLLMRPRNSDTKLFAIGRNLVGEAALDSNHPRAGGSVAGEERCAPSPDPTTS